MLELRVIIEEYYFILMLSVFFNLNKLLMNILVIILNVIIEFDSKNILFYVFCVSDKEFWMSSVDGIMRLYNFRGEIVKLI